MQKATNSSWRRLESSSSRRRRAYKIFITGRLARRPDNLYYSVGAQWGYYSLGASGKGVALEGLVQDTFLNDFVEKPEQPGEGQTS